MAVRQQPASGDSPSSDRKRAASRRSTDGPRPARRSAQAPAPARRSSRDSILALLRKNPYMSTRDLAEEIGISAKGVEKQLGILKATGRLRRIGPDKGGKWEVVV